MYSCRFCGTMTFINNLRFTCLKLDFVFYTVLFRSPDPIAVLNPSEDKAMKVQFNAVIRYDVWNWEKDKSSVYMRFGHKDLGNWKYDIGPCKILR